MQVLGISLFVWLLLGSALGRAAEPVEAVDAEAAATDPGVKLVQDCIDSNLPERSSVQLVEFASVDRIEGERLSLAKIYAKQLPDGKRRLKLRFLKPLDMRKSELLMIETGGPNDIFVFTPDLRRPKRLQGRSAGGSLFGTDFTYEDFERWQGLTRPGTAERREDTVLLGRSVYVLATTPSEEAASSYETIVSFVDQETCVVLKMESYESRGRLRKVMTADPDSVVESGGVRVATQAVMEDLRDGTHTRVLIEDIEVDREISDRTFMVGRMGMARD